METPGLALYDREEVELQGIALQEAKRTAKDTYPTPPTPIWSPEVTRGSGQATGLKRRL